MNAVPRSITHSSVGDGAEKRPLIALIPGSGAANDATQVAPPKGLTSTLIAREEDPSEENSKSGFDDEYSMNSAE